MASTPETRRRRNPSRSCRLIDGGRELVIANNAKDITHYALDAIASLEVRRLDKGRSYLVAGVGAAGLIATTLAFSLTGSGTQPNSGSGRPPKQ